MTKSITNEYNKYITQHIDNVQKGYEWLKEFLPDILSAEVLKKNKVSLFDLDDQIFSHDESKYTDEEWDAYANYFYGEKTKEVKEEFNYAWLHHIHHNPHHWQHWVLINDEDGTTILDMPYNYIIEMISDWWAFSWSQNKLDEIFKWYKSHKKNIMLSDNTRKTVEDILKMLENKLNELELI